MNAAEKLCEVKKLKGQSYRYTCMRLDGPDPIISRKIKEIQAEEFAKVAEIRLFVQKDHYRYKREQERIQEKKRLKEEADSKVIVQPINDELEEEFKDIEISDFVPLVFSEEKLVDIIMDYKMDEIEEADTKKERCCAWVLNHCK